MSGLGRTPQAGQPGTVQKPPGILVVPGADFLLIPTCTWDFRTAFFTTCQEPESIICSLGVPGDDGGLG